MKRESEARPASPAGSERGPHLLGRIAELLRLEQFGGAAAAGRGSALAIVGEPGMGKTSLLESAIWAGDLRLLRALGVEAEMGLPYACLHQLLQPIIQLRGDLPPRQKEVLGVALGLDEGAQPDPFVVALAALGLLNAAAAERPVLCVVDDLHWADAASRAAVLFVARRLNATPISLLLTVRRDEWAAIGERSLPTIDLGELDLSAAIDLITREAGPGVMPDVARRLHEATGGNPLALIEVVRLLQPGQLRGWKPLPNPLPLTRRVEQAFASRIEDLATDTRTLLLAIAADGSGKLHTILRAAEILGVDPAVLDAAIANGLLQVGGGDVRFSHPLIATLVYGRATVEDRKQVHSALAELTKAGDPDRHAWHLSAAAVRPDHAVADALAQAAKRAAGRGAFVEAVSAFERAAELSTEASTRASMLYDAAQAAWMGGQPRAAKDLLDRARRASPTIVAGTEVEALRGVIELSVGDAHRAYRVLVAAANEVRTHDPERALELLALASEAASLALDYPSEIELGRMVAGWEVGDNPKLQVLREALIGFGDRSAGDLEGSMGHLRHAIELAQSLDEPQTLLTAGRAADWAGDDDRSYRFHLAIVEMANERGSLSHVPIAGARLALAEIISGNLAGGSITAGDTVRLAQETGQAELASHPRLWLALVHAMQGNGDLVDKHLMEAFGTAGPRSRELVHDAASWIRSVLALGEGRADDAMSLLEPITHPVIQTFSSLDRFEAAAATGNGRGLDWLAIWARFAESSGAACALARLSHGRAILGSDPQAAEQNLLTALTYHAASRRPFELARTQLALGSLLRRHRERGRSREYLRGALQRFEGLGAVRWAERARAELRATGETVSRGGRPPIEQLTRQELRIAQAVGEGRSNRDIASTLFLSPRTVDFHLRNVFSKLGISSRTELAGMAARGKLLPLAEPTGSPGQAAMSGLPAEIGPR
ncbi:MAG TPA: LuxR C-terminal-related transcriptional regulator [Candidatus Dormibacteraeota bacterium]|nr:LuxR C-terminal-related transcriptional regulator [Candidatus Dormibacteraeota bacterium]